jgi:hypothetical protein
LKDALAEETESTHQVEEHDNLDSTAKPLRKAQKKKRVKVSSSELVEIMF